jgi:hypothetical protein
LLLFAGEVASFDLLDGLADLLLMQSLLLGHHYPELLSLLLIISEPLLEKVVEITHFVKFELELVDKLFLYFVFAALLVGALPPILLLLESLLPFPVRLEQFSDPQLVFEFSLLRRRDLLLHHRELLMLALGKVLEMFAVVAVLLLLPV